MSHSRKILSQAGVSLADVYDVEGSVVGLENLDVSDIKGVHDLGPQIHSERLQVFNLIADSTAVAQNVTWNIELGAFPDSINRLLSVFVMADTAARTAHCAISIRDPLSLIDHVIWAWQSVVDIEANLLWAAPTVGTQVGLRVLAGPRGDVPTLIARTGASAAMPTLFFRGLSLGFGAGTVRVRALIQIARPDEGNPAPGAPSSHGLPIPSW